MDSKQEKPANLVERIMLTRDGLLEAERRILQNEHIRRYAAIRRFCYGRTLDFASGCGYGTFLLAVNPDVTEAIGIDQDPQALAWSRREFVHTKLHFRNAAVEDLDEPFDTLVCLETIEHLKDVRIVPELVERCKIDNIIVSFPDKKTTHYNPFHFHDFVTQEIVDLFPRHLIYHSIRFVDSQSVMLVRAPKNAPAHLFRNVRDL